MPFRRRPTPAPLRLTSGHAGFCVAGYMHATGGDPGIAQELRTRIARDARLTREMGGDLLRIFWSVDSVIDGSPEECAIAVNTALRPELFHRSVFLHPLEHRVDQLDRANAALDQLLLAAGERPESSFRLDFTHLDAVFDGLDDANRDGGPPVGLMLALVSAPPRWIIEAPSDITLRRMERFYTWGSLWDRYIRFHAELYRRLVYRYAVQRSEPTLRALEVFNEPDYNWTPEEVKIEGASEVLVNPQGKYLTELRLTQIPLTDRGYQSFEAVPWGFAAQDANWTENDRLPIGVLDFDWGPKFDWYVMCAAQFQTHAARAIKSAARDHGVDVATVSGSVTHNNIDFLLRMYRGDRATFDHIDKIGLHPYHWRDNDVWDDAFVSDETISGWPRADPRAFAARFMKRFDFLEAFRGRSGDTRVDSELQAAFGDRPLWLTEFGIGSKVLTGFNTLAPELNRYVRPRSWVGASAGYDDVVWDDLWQAFLQQVDEPWMRRRGVECMLLYGLREFDTPGFDLHDEDRSNMAVLHEDGTPRLDAGLVRGISRLLGSMTGHTTPTLEPEAPAAGAPPELYRRSWRGVELSHTARQVTTMLSIEERQLLYWLTSDYYSGAGAIVDGGPFVGGSTIPLAEGLKASGHPGTIDVYDRFEVEPYMNDLYLNDDPRASSGSFLPVYESNIRDVADRVRIHAGDLMAQTWPGDPIELLFVDLAKTWELNDFIVANFFPSLIAGHSVVVQQDFVFAICPWVALTMEHLAEYFEPLAFAEYCSVVYLTHSEIPPDVEPVSSLSHERRLALMDSAIGRFRGYPHEVLRCAKAALLVDHGDREQADALLATVAQAQGAEHPAVQAALAQLGVQG